LVLRATTLHYHRPTATSEEGIPMNKSGIVLIIIGCVFLANNFGLLQFDWLRQWWPLILIGVGVYSLLNHKPGDKSSSGTDKPQA
jgi:hypothetical protein